MPCATIHLLLARRVLSGWEGSPSTSPIPARLPEVRTAFLHGALAPDMGFVPGTDRFLSELAHYHSPAELTRALLRRARGVVDEAFAWGWATHVLGDVTLHPVIGRVVGEVLHGDRGRRVDAVENVAMHVGVEVGLDMHFLERHRDVPLPPGLAHSAGSGMELVRGALQEVYQLRWDAGPLVRDHRHAVRMTRWWPKALRALARAPRVLTARAPRDSATGGFFRPRTPPDWAVTGVTEVVEAFAEAFRPIVDSGMATLENRNLETGGVAGSGRGHRASDEVDRRLVRLQKG